jgi:hypothetical protein
MHLEAIVASRETVADAFDEISFSFVTRMMTSRQHDDMIAFLHNRVCPFVRFET